MSPEAILYAVLIDIYAFIDVCAPDAKDALAVDTLVREGHLEWRRGVDGMQCLEITDAGRERVTRWLDPGTRADLGLEVTP